MKIEARLARNLAVIKDELGADTSFDVLIHEFKVGEKDAVLLYIDAFIQTLATVNILRTLREVKREEIVPHPVEKVARKHLPYFELEITDEFETVFDGVLSGQAALFIDGDPKAVVVDVRNYPVRAIQEPDLERVTRGSRDGFVETAIFNTILIRRRLRDPKLRFEAMQVGDRSKTDVFIGYISDVANPDLVAEVKNRIKKVDVQALAMGNKSLEEFIAGTKFNPLPTVRYTERPDVVVAHLMEGYVVIITDTSPTAMIVPAMAWHFTQHAEEYFHNPVVGTYLRWVRFFAFFLSFFLTSVWLLFATNRELLPAGLEFIGPKETTPIPLFIQFILLELAIDVTRMAFIHTPTALATSLGLVAAILLGEFAVNVGLFVPETVLYQAIAAIAFFAIPNYEFALAIRLFRFLLLVTTGLFGLYGFLGGGIFTFLVMAFTRSFKVPYLWPLVPLDWQDLRKMLFRYPLPSVKRRPTIITAQDSDLLQTDRGEDNN